MKTCWRGKFLDDGDPRKCHQEARWRGPDSLGSIVAAFEWCDQHRHDNDVRLPQEPRTPPDGGDNEGGTR